MIIIKCSNCESIFEEDQVNVWECSECKTDEFLATHEEIQIKSCDECNRNFDSDLEEIHTQCNKIICYPCFVTSSQEYKIKNKAA